MLLWAHTGWGQRQHHQQPPVDATAVNVLSLSVLHRVQALLNEGGLRSLQEIAIHAHIGATRELLGDFPYYDGEIAAEKSCDVCVWQYLGECSTRLPGDEALRWFQLYKPSFSCGKHLDALNQILARLPVPHPQLEESQWDLSSVDVRSNLLKISRLVLPLQVRLLLPVVLLPSLVSAVSPDAPEPGMALTLKPLQQSQDRVAIEVVELSYAVEEPAQLQRPPDRQPPEAPPTPPPGRPLSPPPPGLGEAPIAGRSTPGLTPSGTTGRGPPPVPEGGPNGTGSSRAGTGRGAAPIVDRPSPGGDGRATGPTAGRSQRQATASRMLEVAHDLSVLLQRRGRPCTSGGRVFAVREGGGLFIDGRRPQLADIDAMERALKECKE
ncbi:hypothetical protein [Archangium violaceum]|nr:hypothetical protein [Archangium violaceum]